MPLPAQTDLFPRQTPGRTHVLRIGGMHCAACGATVQRALESQRGVRGSRVDHLAGMATVEADPSCSGQELVDAIRRSGYTAERIEADANPAGLLAEAELSQRRAEFLWRRRSQIGFALWLPMEALHWFTAARGDHSAAVDATLLIGSTLSMALVGSGFWKSAWSALRVHRTNMDVLIALGATTAYVASLAIFAAQRAGALHGQPTWFSEAAALLAIISLGHWFEARATKSAGAAVRELLELQPEQAERQDSAGATEMIQSRDIRESDLIVVRPGGRVPADGVIESGEADLDESVMTGEPLPVRRAPGDQVSAGTMCLTGMLRIRATAGGRATSLSRIAALLQNAQTSRPPIQRMADRVASVFVPLVLSIAAVTAIGWGVAGSWPTGIAAATAVLIISCPCALGLAGPMAVMVGTGEAGLRGILIKDAAALERAGRVDTVLFDKTGTLTTGEPVVAGVEMRGTLPLQEALKFAASVEQGSEHPIARAILRRAAEEISEIPAAAHFESTPGLGVKARVEGRWVELRRDATATCVLLVDGEIAARFILTDALRGDARRVVESLRASGLAAGLITGDRLHEALRIAREAGIDESMVAADATPEGKLDMIRRYGPRAIMVGDGINDAAALAAAGLGVAMGGGTAIASESAAIVLVGSRLASLPELIRIARATLRCMRQNLFLAFVYNAVAIPLAALALLGAYGPAIAAAAMACSDISVIGNALRLKWSLKRRRARTDSSAG